MTRYISDYTTREDVSDQLEKGDPGSGVPAPVTAEYNEFVAYVDRAVHAASQFLSRTTYRVFVPYKDTREYYFADMRIDNNLWCYYGDYGILRLDDDLIVTGSITWDGTLLSVSYYREHPNNRLPYSEIRFDRDNLPSWGTDFGDAIAVDGTWGYHDNLSQAYTTIEGSITINDSSTSLTVADAALYRTWQYIRLESELMQITARNESTEVLTVRRGVNGTTAASHSNVSVEVFNMVDDIRLAATRLAAWLYNHRNDLGTQLILTDGSAIRNEVPAMVDDTIASLRRYVSYSA